MLEPYVQINPPCVKKFLIFDIDHEIVSRWDNENVLTPNVIIRNKHNKKAHLIYQIDDVLMKSVNDDVIVREKPLNWLKAIYYGMCKQLGADKNVFNAITTKNPFFPGFDTEFLHSRVYTLTELANNCEPDLSVYSPKKFIDLDINNQSRVMTLFHKVRLEAYRDVERYRATGCLNEFHAHVLKLCQRENEFQGKGFKVDGNIDKAQISATAKSIAVWTWNYYRGHAKNRGVMNLDESLNKTEKHKAGALYTATQKSLKTAENLKQAYLKLSSRLQSKDRKPTQRELAEFTCYSISTIKRYWRELSLKRVTDNAASKKEKQVSLGVHKVSSSPIFNKPTAVFSYVAELNVFALNNDLKTKVLNHQNFLECTYRYNKNTGRTNEVGSLLNLQTTEKSLRRRLLKGWSEIDLTLSHGQMLGRILNKFSSPYAVEHKAAFNYFISELDTFFKDWSKLVSIDSKLIKKALVAAIHGASFRKLNEILLGKLKNLLSNLEFYEVYQAILYVRKNVNDLSKRIARMESSVFKPYWGCAVLIHDAVVVQQTDLVIEIQNWLDTNKLLYTTELY